MIGESETVEAGNTESPGSNSIDQAVFTDGFTAVKASPERLHPGEGEGQVCRSGRGNLSIRSYDESSGLLRLNRTQSGCVYEAE